MARDGFAEATIGHQPANQEGAQRLQTLCTTATFHVTLVDDLVGVDLCGALKNCVAIACGLGSASMGNTRAAIIRRGQGELRALCLDFFPNRPRGDLRRSMRHR